MSDEWPVPLRDDLGDLRPYRAPQPDVGIRLNTNECPWPPPEPFLRDVADALARLELHRYPDREVTAVRAGLATRHGVRPEQVWVGNGSNELIQQLLLAFGGPGRRVLLFEPTYAMHTHIARMTGTEIVAKVIEEPWRLDADTVGWVTSIDPPTMTFICSPNNPTGNAHDLSVVAAALEKGTGLVIVDEAYGDFGGESARELLDEHDRLVILRSMSKSWRLAGARLGYLLAHPWVVDALQVTRLPYHLSATSQAVAEVALRHQRLLMAGVGEIVAERDRLAKELARVPGVEVFPSDANFVLFRTPFEPAAVWQAMLDRGVLIRDVGIPERLRVSVGTPEENDTFLQVAADVAKEEML
jgi:histidinol-phosphate aminotransferase